MYINRYYELDATVPQTHIYAGDLKVATVEDGTDVIYHHADHLTGTNVDTDDSGSVLEVLDYYPYGNVRLDDKSGTYENAYKYTGKELDEETDLYYYGARYYNAAIGRFVSQDPLIFDEAVRSGQSMQKALINPQMLNGYSYVANNPMKAIDPTGEILFLVTTPPPLSSTSDYENYKRESSSVNNSYPIDETGKQINSLDTQLKTSSISVQPAIESGIMAGLGQSGLAEGMNLFSTIQNNAGSGIGSTGKIGENELKKFGGQSQVPIQTSQGTRVIDQLVDKAAHESKVGYTSLTKETLNQVKKDAELLQNNSISNATWHFFESPVTGKVGPSKPLSNTLQKSGIDINIHYP